MAYLAKSTIKRAGVPTAVRIGAEVDTETCSKREVGQKKNAREAPELRWLAFARNFSRVTSL